MIFPTLKNGYVKRDEYALCLKGKLGCLTRSKPMEQQESVNNTLRRSKLLDVAQNHSRFTQDSISESIQ